MSKHDETTKSEQMEKIKPRVVCSLAEEMLNYFKEVFEGWAEDKCTEKKIGCLGYHDVDKYYPE